MLKRKNRKGFTLAELLIVVAIIAVLTAIAVPLFVSQLKKANEAVFEANRDAVRSAGIVKILSDETYDLSKLTETNNVVAVTGTFVKENGKFVLDSVAVEEPKAVAEATAETTFDGWNTSDTTKLTIVVHLKATDMSK